MSDTKRTQIVDKNGKVTHVHKGSEDIAAPVRIPSAISTPPIDEVPKAKAFPDAAALHSYSCKCADCLSGKSINYSDWEDKATVGDVVAMLKSSD